MPARMVVVVFISRLERVSRRRRRSGPARRRVRRAGSCACASVRLRVDRLSRLRSGPRRSRGRRGRRWRRSSAAVGVHRGALPRVDVREGSHRSPSGSIMGPCPARTCVEWCIGMRSGSGRPAVGVDHAPRAGANVGGRVHRVRSVQGTGLPSGSIIDPWPARICVVVCIGLIVREPGCRWDRSSPPGPRGSASSRASG